MKRHFVACIAVVVWLTAAAYAQKTNLQLILEGPLAVCEDSSTTPLTLVIFVPNLQGSHYLAGFSSELDGFVPPDNKSTEYLEYPDNIDYVMNITGPNGTTPSRGMALQLATSVIPFYSENGDCPKTNRALSSFSLRIPVADEVWPENPTEYGLYVRDHPVPGMGSPHTEGPPNCRTSKCQYATKIVLRYSDVDPKSICLLLDGTKTCATGNPVWTPVKTGAIGGPAEVELKINLGAEPTVVPDYITHAMHAFRKASNVAGVLRDLDYGTYKPFIPATHKVCQVPPLFVCKTGTACNQ